MSTPPDRDHERHRRIPTTHIGLRARITVTFTVGAMVIVLIIATSTITLTRRALIQSRETRAAERAQRNAEFLSTQLTTRERVEDLTELLSSLQTPAEPLVWLRDSADPENRPVWTRDAKLELDDLPSSLRNRVMWSYQSGMIRSEVTGEPSIVIGIPLTQPSGSYFEVESLADIESTIRTLGIVLGVSGILTVLAGAGLGWWSSRRVLKPLSLIGDAAKQIADGHLETRLDAADYSEDPELGPLVSSFNEMVAALQGRIDQDARFASDVSHELRSPLTTLTASVAVLRNAEDDLPKRARTALNLLETDITRFSQLVEDLLEISRFDAGAVKLELEESVLSEQIRSFLSRSSASGADLTVSPQLDGRLIECDKRRIIRILANFVENAEKYAGGVIAVTMEKEGNLVIIGVEDDGPGVPPDERSRIFSRFSRGVQGGARGSDTGSGLGLALASEHARLHGGRVWVEERSGGETGARFVVSLPLLPEPMHDDDTANEPAEDAEEVEPAGVD